MGRPKEFDRDVALSKAMGVFWRRGYEGTSVHDLAGAMGINKPSLYATFGCKKALFREAIELYERTQGAPIALSLEKIRPARAAVEEMLQANAQAFTAAGKPRGC